MHSKDESVYRHEITGKLLVLKIRLKTNGKTGFEWENRVPMWLGTG